MKEFPRLIDKQVALIRSEYNTGHVLDENFILATNSEQKVFTLFETLTEALLYSKKKFIEMNNIEFAIYDKNQKLLYFIRSLNDFETLFPNVK